jgi:hypothetical protein
MPKNQKFHLRRASSGGNTCWATPCQPYCPPIHPLPFITHSSPLSPSSSPLLALCAYTCLPSPPCFSCRIQSHSILSLTHLHISQHVSSQLSLVCPPPQLGCLVPNDHAVLPIQTVHTAHSAALFPQLTPAPAPPVTVRDTSPRHTSHTQTPS